ncbi:MAG: CoA transferase [Chloroflexi bacterium]|nr:CoA transferase [Chloroflexota bacterium]
MGCGQGACASSTIPPGKRILAKTQGLSCKGQSRAAAVAKQALQGLHVLEYGSFISAAYCCKLMADLGAEVIKIEPLEGGDEARWHGPFLW